MLRSAQMLLGQALRLHYQGREWKPPSNLVKRRRDEFVQDMLTWFADFPSTTTCRFSLHNMVAAGMAKYETLPGEWYGPSTACYVLRDLVQLFEHHQQQTPPPSPPPSSPPSCRRSKIFRIHVASQGTVYRDELHRLMTQQRTKQHEKDKESSTSVDNDVKKTTDSLSSSLSLFHPLDPSYQPQTTSVPVPIDYDVAWDTALLLLIPLRLGLKCFHSDYVQSLAFSFSLPQSVGVLGGRPRGARWFYGATSDGSRVLGLDPHTIQMAPQLAPRRQQQQQPLQVDLTDDYLQSVHTSFPEVFSLSKMDPSIALGFYCQNNAALEHLLQAFAQWKRDHPNLPELFTVAETTPDYLASSSSSSLMMDDPMTMSGISTNSTDYSHQQHQHQPLSQRVKSISLLDDLAGDDDDEDDDDDDGGAAAGNEEDSHASDEYVML